MIYLGQQLWRSSSPTINVQFWYEKYRNGTSMFYRLQTRMWLNSFSWYNNRIRGVYNLNGSVVYNNLIKGNTTSTNKGWDVTVVTPWFEVGNKITGTTPYSLQIYDDNTGGGSVTYNFNPDIDSATPIISIYEVSRTQIIRKSGEIEGLSVITSDGRFTFALNGTPFRGVRNDPKKLPNKKLIKSLGAIRQIELLKKDEQCSEYAELIWYIVFDTYYKHPADNIYVVGYSEKNEIICQWEVPLDKVTLISSVNSEKAQAIEQPEPKPRLKSHNFTQKSSNDEK